MNKDPAWILLSGFFVLGTLIATVVGGGGFLFLSGYHAGLMQHPECPEPVSRK